MPGALLQSCLIELPGLTDQPNEELVKQRAALWKALQDCDKARAEAVSLLTR